MDASIQRARFEKRGGPGRFTSVSIETGGGELEVRLSEFGRWELRVRRDADSTWRLACAGNVGAAATPGLPMLRPSPGPIVRGPLMVDSAAQVATINGGKIELARKEFTLLAVLASEPERVFEKSELLRLIWGVPDPTKLKTRTLDSHASRLRRKLQDAGVASMVINCWGVGYRLWDGVPPSLETASPPTGVRDLAAAS